MTEEVTETEGISMKLYRPKSFFILLLTGFAFVTLPLLIALGSAEYSINSLAKQNVLVVHHSVALTKDSRLLMDHLLSQERKARLYDVLGESTEIEEIKKKQTEINQTIQRLLKLPFKIEEKGLLHELLEAENAFIIKFLNNKRKSPLSQAALKDFSALYNVTRKILTASQTLMTSENEKYRNAVQQAQTSLLWQTSFLITLSIFLLWFFAYLLIRPIRQIDHALVRLGDGNFLTPVDISGPKDLELLGTRLDWLRSRLADLEKEKNKFVAHVSHELKTPLASVRESTGLLEEGVVGPLNKQQKKVVQILSKNSRQLQKLIENIVNFNMAQLRNHPLSNKNFRLDTLTLEIIEDHKAVLISNNLTLDIKINEASVCGDPDQIGTIIDNLLSNAIKHSPSGEKIYISLQANKDNAIFDIVDSGSGVLPEERNKIFTPFYQGENAVYKGIKGTGLGLAIAREYVANHNGTLELLSSEESEGAHFRMILPLGDN
jgi:two-component system, NtrC family, sensor histidine kinase GlrK